MIPQYTSGPWYTDWLSVVKPAVARTVQRASSPYTSWHFYTANSPVACVDQAVAPTVGASSVTETVKALLSKLMDVVGTLLGNKEGGGGGGSGGGGLKAKAKSSKPKRSKTSGAGFKEAFEAKYGKR